MYISVMMAPPRMFYRILMRANAINLPQLVSRLKVRDDFNHSGRNSGFGSPHRLESLSTSSWVSGIDARHVRTPSSFCNSCRLHLQATGGVHASSTAGYGRKCCQGGQRVWARRGHVSDA